LEKPIYYVYPQHHDVSFKFVAKEHVKMLKEKYTVYEIPALSFYQFTPFKYPISIIHPFFYSMWHWSKVEFSFFEQYRTKVSEIIGVEVADSNKIAEKYIEYGNNYADKIIVNSEWSKNAFKNSGLKVPIFNVVHNFNLRLLAKDEELKIDEQVKYIEKVKKEKKIKLIFISLWHSDFRKGGDIFHAIAKEIQKERDDIYFLVKSGGPRTDFKDLKMFNLTGNTDFDNIIKMYRISDLYLLPSRGGSFELNGLEAFISKIPVIATKNGAWEEYFPPQLKDLLVNSCNFPTVLPGNPIHIGKGVQMCTNEAIDKTLEVIDKLDEYKAKIEENYNFWLENFSYNAVKKQLLNTVRHEMLN
jgi:glycosyltransferase involved in cell wall biosynthesis